MTGNIWTAATALALIVGVPALAAEPPKVTEAAAEQAPRGTTPEERSNTARLNAEQAARARADNLTYQQEVQAADQQAAADQAEFADETLIYEEEKARLAAMAADDRLKYEADLAAWRADVAACEAGDRSRCAKPRPTLPPRP